MKQQNSKIKIIGVFLLLFTMACFSAFAEEPAKKKPTIEEATNAALKVVNPKLKINAVTFDEKLQMYKVTVNKNFMFMTQDMKYAFIGDVIDVQSGKSILYTPKKADFSTLPLQDAITVGNGQYKLAMFIDMNCSYCHKLYQEMSQNKDITMYVYLLPFLGKDSRDKAERVLRSSDRAKALDDVLVKGVALKDNQSAGDSSLLDRNMNLAQSLNIRSTPTLIFTDGSNSVGYMPAEKLHTLIVAKGK